MPIHVTKGKTVFECYSCRKTKTVAAKMPASVFERMNIPGRVRLIEDAGWVATADSELNRVVCFCSHECKLAQTNSEGYIYKVPHLLGVRAPKRRRSAVWAKTRRRVKKVNPGFH